MALTSKNGLQMQGNMFELIGLQKSNRFIENFNKHSPVNIFRQYKIQKHDNKKEG